MPEKNTKGILVFITATRTLGIKSYVYDEWKNYSKNVYNAR